MMKFYLKKPRQLGKRLSRVVMSLMLVSFCLSYARAQERTVTGRITDDTGGGLPGVNVIIQGTTTGTVTDIDGNYRISVPEDAVLVFSAVGFETQEIAPGSRSVVDVSLLVDIAELAEVVVTGYATQNKKDVTGSVAVVKPKELVAVPAGNITNQLQGRVAGVTVVGSGQPGATSKVRIRGFSSFLNNDPLYIVDGVPTTSIASLNPDDVESLSVLKDAGAASIYGSRASNGVIVITTKKGQAGGISVNAGYYTGVQNPGDGPDNVLNTQQYADLQWLVYANDGLNGTVDRDMDGTLDSEDHPIYGSSANANPSLPSWAGDTDWFDETTDPAPISNLDVSMSGGNQDSRFYASLNYFKQDGIVIHTGTERITGRFNSDFNIQDRVTVGENLSVTYTKNHGNFGNLSEGNAISGIYRNQPIIPVIMDQEVAGISHNFVPGEFGGTGLAPRLGNNPNRVANLIRNKDDESFGLRLVGNFFVDVEILDGLNVRSTYGGTYGTNYFTNYTFATYENAENVATAAFSEGSSFGRDWVWTNTLTYDKEFGDNLLKLVAGYEALEFDIGRGVSGARGGYFSDAVGFRTLSNGATILNASSGVGTPTTLASSFVRADYSYMDKYLLGATVRRDGSSRFGEDNKYGIFPSFSAGWRISEEGFLQGSAVFTDVKIRGGWGTMGNQSAINPANAFFLFGSGAGSSNYDLNGSGTSSLQGFRPTRIGNPDAQWETNVTTNIGIDAGLFDNQLEVIFDWYKKETQDLLYNPELPGTAGAASQPFINVAEMKNTGIDLQIIYRNQITSDLNIETNLTLTSYTNEIVKIANGVDEFNGPFSSRIGPFTLNRVGHGMSEFYGYQVEGLFQSDSEVSSAPTQDGAEPGFFRYADIDGDGEITPDDRTFIGDPNPDFTYGLNLVVGYRNWELVAYFYGYQGGDIFNYSRWWTDFWPSFQGQKSTDLLNNSWTESRTNATVPKASNVSNFSTNTVSSSYYIEDGTFSRLKNLQIKYRVPASALQNIGLGSAEIYLQGVNLFTFTKYSGLDPELGGDDRNFGIDRGNYPIVKQFLVGVRFGI